MSRARQQPVAVPELPSEEENESLSLVYDHILVIGFGGPTRPEDVQPFLEEVTRGVPIPPARLEEVIRHYEAVGGRSPYNEHTERLCRALEAVLRRRGVSEPLFLGMRHWHPFLRETIHGIRGAGLTHGLGVILAPHRSDASFDKYVRSVEQAQAGVSAPGIRYDYLRPWHDHPLFIEAQAEQVRPALRGPASGAREGVHLLFSAHAIPVEMAERSRYVEEVRRSSELVAAALGHPRWSVAYQSRSGDPRQAWLTPAVVDAMRELRAHGVRQVIAVPIGFLCDNVEVLYDLDLEARQSAASIGIGFTRAPTVHEHPAFVQMLADLIGEALQTPARH